MDPDPLKHAQIEYIRAQTREIEDRNRERQAERLTRTVIVVAVITLSICMIVLCVGIMGNLGQQVERSLTATARPAPTATLLKSLPRP